MEIELKNKPGGTRNSNLELYRIIMMLLIVAHHYVVNSGLMTLINESNILGWNSVFLLLFGCWGKIGINCFVLITGYFMCKSSITLKKFLKLFLEWMFYKYLFYFIFVISGYETFSLKGAINSLVPFLSITDGFTSCYIVFYLFIPFLNILIHGMNEKQHRWLLVLTIGVFSVWASIPIVNVGSSYVFWFMTLYLISSYIRLYPISIFSNTRFWGKMSLLAIVCSFASVLFMVKANNMKWIDGGFYLFVADSNKITALAVSICFFMFFKNWHLKHNRFINTVAASTFGVLCIHANSDTMREFIWQDLFNNVSYYNSPYLVLHAVSVSLLVFIICIVIDYLRISFIEKRFFRYLDKMISSK